MMAGLDRYNPKQAELTGLRVTLDAKDPAWELPPVKNPGCPIALIGWLTDIEPVDQGVPALARALISRSLTRRSRVTFPHPDGGDGGHPEDWQQTAGGWIKVLKPRPSVSLRRRARIALLSTTSAEVAVRLFAAFPYSWEMKSQVAILSDPQAPPPNLSYETVEALLDREPIDETPLVAEAPVRGLLVPAVDGDFAALIAFDPVLLRGIVDGLAEECARAGVSWETVKESALLGK